MIANRLEDLARKAQSSVSQTFCEMVCYKAHTFHINITTPHDARHYLEATISMGGWAHTNYVYGKRDDIEGFVNRIISNLDGWIIRHNKMHKDFRKAMEQ